MAAHPKLGYIGAINLSYSFQLTYCSSYGACVFALLYIQKQLFNLRPTTSLRIGYPLILHGGKVYSHLVQCSTSMTRNSVDCSHILAIQQLN